MLTNLIILELHGNPLVDKLENYRIYVVFQLPSLKALDGVGVVGVYSKALCPHLSLYGDMKEGLASCPHRK